MLALHELQLQIRASRETRSLLQAAPSTVPLGVTGARGADHDGLWAGG